MIAISYRREDTASITGRIYDRLQAVFGRDGVFIDLDSIPFGADFRSHISESLKRCDTLLVVIGPRWLGELPGGSRRIDDQSDFVRIEVAQGLAQNTRVVPLLIERTDMPPSETLPEDLRSLAFRNALRVDSGADFHHHMDRLCSSLQGVPLRSSASPEVARRVTSPAPIPRRDPVVRSLGHNSASPPMDDAASKILVSELGKLGGIGARIAARFLKDVSHEEVFDVAGSVEDTQAAAVAVLLEIGTSRAGLPDNSVLCGSGHSDLNPTILSVTVTPSGSGASVHVHAVAKEGFVKQESAKKAVDRFVALLSEPTGLTRRCSEWPDVAVPSLGSVKKRQLANPDSFWYSAIPPLRERSSSYYRTPTYQSSTGVASQRRA